MSKTNQKITLTANKKTETANLYSERGLEMVSKLWLKLYVHNKLTHELTWMGIPIIQFPEDILMMQELIWKIKPDIIIESGLAHGGSALFYASLLELMGRGRVIGIDIKIRPHNKKTIRNHPLSHRIDMIEGSSTSEKTINTLRKMVRGAKRVMVVLDSNHSVKHVTEELELYRELVTPGSYLVVMDGAQAFCWNIPRGKPEWKDDNPLRAIEEFLKKNSEFKADDHYNRLKVTSNPRGFLRRLTKKEITK